MALIVHPEGTQVSGSIGGTTFSHNRSGAYKRNRSIPVNPNTDRQANVRNIVRSLAIAWDETLTQGQRNSWDLYAANVAWVNKLGQSINLTGLNHYIRSNTPRLLFPGPLPRIDDGPTQFMLATAELALSVTASEATQQYTLNFDDTAGWATVAGSFQVFYAGLPKNGGTKFFNGPWRTMAAAFGADPAVSPKIGEAPFPIAQGQRLWVRTRIGWSNGRLSEFARVNFLCAA